MKDDNTRCLACDKECIRFLFGSTGDIAVVRCPFYKDKQQQHTEKEGREV